MKTGGGLGHTPAHPGGGFGAACGLMSRPVSPPPEGVAVAGAGRDAP